MRILILGILFCCTSISLNAQVKLTIQLRVDTTLGRPDKIFLAGDMNNWDPKDSSYQLVYSNGFYKSNFIFPPGKSFFKFTRGSWSTVEKDIHGADIPNREIELYSDTTLFMQVDKWSEVNLTNAIEHTTSPQVTIMDSAFYIPQINGHRRIWIYLPPNYSRSKKRYPVIYAQDGQNLFDKSTSFAGEWRIDETLDSVYEAEGISCIVIGIDNDSTRVREYNPFDNEMYGAGLGNTYVDFITKTLKPYVDAHYRTLRDPANTMIIGSSLGGLISYYAALTKPDIFGKAGVFSPSFWIAPQMDSLTAVLSNRTRGQFFFYAGGKEGEQMVSDMFRISDKLSANSKVLAYTIVDEDGIHNESAWRKWFPEFVKWIFSNGYEYQLSVN